MNRQALVVGINRYPFIKQHLQKSASDAEAIAHLLETYGDFEVHRLPVTNIGRQVDPLQLLREKDLEQAIHQLFYPTNGIVPETALLYFAGHGWQRKADGETEGFLFTSDANPRKDIWGISLKWLREILETSPVRQQIIWLDCCHSGELFNFANTNLGEYERGRDRCFIAASREFQSAYGGVLTPVLLQGLDPSNSPDDWVTNYTLKDSIEAALKNAPQHPVLSNTGGQIILTSKGGVRGNICPYRGLGYFDFNDEDPKYFYGRAALTKQLLEKVQKSNFLTVLGASGSGKSSAVRAGLLHQLKMGKLPGSDRWKIYEPFTPGDRPLSSLEQVIGVKANQVEALIKAAAADRVVLVADQFEEVFTQCRDEAERQQFFECLMGAVKRLGNKLCLVLVMRSDFQGKCDEYTELATKIDQNLVRVRQMSQEELREAIVKPAERVGLEIDRELVNQAIADVSGSPGDLPLLQYILTQLWEQRTLNRMTISDYTRLGGVKKALENHANLVYQNLSADEQLVAKQIFLELTHLGEGMEDTHQQVRQEDLVAEKRSPDIVERVVQRLAKEKLVITGEQEFEGTRVPVANIAHEALIRHWGLLGKWLKENREALLRKQDIEEAAKEWRDNRKSGEAAYLLRDTRLAAAEDYIKRYADTVPLSKLAQDFVQKSIKERRKSRLILFGSVATFIVGIGSAAIVAFLQRNGAIQSEITAQIELADSRLSSNDQLGGLVASLKAATQLKQVFGVPNEIRVRVAATLQQTVYGIQEINRFEWESRRFEFVSFSPDAQMIVAKSLQQISLWHPDGTLLKTFDAVLPNIKELRFSPDGKIIAETSSSPLGGGFAGGSLWNWNGTLIKKFPDKENVWELDFSSDDQFIVSGSDRDGKISFWNRNGILLKSFQGHDGFISDIKMSPDDRTVVSSSSDGTIKVCKIDGTLLSVIPHGLGVRDNIKLISDGQLIAYIDNKLNTSGKLNTKLWKHNGAVKLWKYDGTLFKIFQHSDRISQVSFSPDDQLIVTASADKTVKLWSRDGTLLQTLQHEDEVYDASFSPDSQAIVTGSADGTVKLWRRDGTLLKTIKGHNLGVDQVMFSPDGQNILSTSLDKTLKFWRKNGNLLTPLEHSNSIKDITFSPDGQIIASGSNDGTISLWRRDNGLLKVLKGHSKAIETLNFSPDGQRLASVSEDGTVKLWKPDGTLLYTWDSNSISFSPDGKIIALGNQDGTVQFWSFDGRLLKIWKASDNLVKEVKFSSTDNSIITFDRNGYIKYWNYEGILLKNLDHQRGKISPDNRIIVDIATLQEPDVSAEWGSFRLYNSDGKEIATIKGHNSFMSDVAFSPDGQSFATAGADNIVKIWSPDGKELATLRGHSDQVRSVSYSPDSKTIATASADNTVKLWSRDGSLLQTLKGHGALVDKIVFSPDGKTLASFSNGIKDKNEVILWNLDIDELLVHGCDWVRPYLKNNPNITQADRHICNGIGSEAQLLVDEGKTLALEGDIKGAIAKFSKAKQLNAKLNLNPETEAQLFKIAAVDKLVEEGKRLIRGRGEVNILGIEGAIAKFQKAWEIEPKSGQITAGVLLDTLYFITQKGDIQKAILVQAQAQDLDAKLKISVDTWNRLCFYGSLYGYAAKVMDACERVVSLSPYTRYRDSRGIARVLIGNKQGAIEDFQAYINYSQTNNLERLQRQRWINDLRAGKNPLTPEELEKLK